MSSKRVVLIVDQGGTVRLLLHGVLRDAGFAVLSTTNGQDALSAIEQVVPDLLLLDGRGLLSAIRQRGLRVPCVMLVSSDAHRDSAQALDVEAVVVKPFHLDQMLALVQYVLTPDQLPEPVSSRLPSQPVVEVAGTRVA